MTIPGPQTFTDAPAIGASHAHTVRILGRSRLRIIHACFRDGMPYDLAVHRTRRTTATA